MRFLQAATAADKEKHKNSGREHTQNELFAQSSSSKHRTEAQRASASLEEPQAERDEPRECLARSFPVPRRRPPVPTTKSQTHSSERPYCSQCARSHSAHRHTTMRAVDGNCIILLLVTDPTLTREDQHHRPSNVSRSSGLSSTFQARHSQTLKIERTRTSQHLQLCQALKIFFKSERVAIIWTCWLVKSSHKLS